MTFKATNIWYKVSHTKELYSKEPGGLIGYFDEKIFAETKRAILMRVDPGIQRIIDHAVIEEIKIDTENNKIGRLKTGEDIKVASEDEKQKIIKEMRDKILRDFGNIDFFKKKHFEATKELLKENNSPIISEMSYNAYNLFGEYFKDLNKLILLFSKRK